MTARPSIFRRQPRPPLPRPTALFRRHTLEQLERMPLVDVDVVLALAWKRIEKANRLAPAPRSVPGDWRLDCIERAVKVLELEPLPPPTKAMARVMENDRRRHHGYDLVELHAQDAYTEAFAQDLEERDREEYEHGERLHVPGTRGEWPHREVDALEET